MCRSIKVLRRPQERVTPEEVTAAALQFVRKVSGFHKPSKANQSVFDAAVAEVAAATQRLLAQLPNPPHPRQKETVFHSENQSG